MAKIFIIGGAGFIGSHTVDLCVEQGYSVTVYDIKPWKSATNLHHQEGKITYIEGDILDQEHLQKSMDGQTHVLHLAALVSVPESIEDPVRFHDVNVTGTLHVFEVAKKIGMKRVVYASSAAVYGSGSNEPVSEQIPTAPFSPYGAHKVMNDMYADLYSSLFSISLLGLRYFNVYGDRQDPGSPYSGAISIFAQKVKSNEAVIIYGDGSATRDFVSVYDVAQANLQALLSSGDGVCNIGTGESCSISEVVATIESILGVSVEKQYMPVRNGDIQNSCALIERAKKLIGFIPRDTLESGLRKMLSSSTN